MHLVSSFHRGASDVQDRGNLLFASLESSAIWRIERSSPVPIRRIGRRLLATLQRCDPDGRAVARILLTAIVRVSKITERTLSHVARCPVFSGSLAMDKRRLVGFRKRLEAKYAELDLFLSKTQTVSRELGEKRRGDEGEEATLSYNREMLYSQGDSGRTQLMLVRDALIRLDEGEFGICESCGCSIGFKRLDAVPWTRYCRDCQEEVESGTALPGER